MLAVIGTVAAVVLIAAVFFSEFLINFKLGTFLRSASRQRTTRPAFSRPVSTDYS
jgi:hypothetical protein